MKKLILKKALDSQGRRLKWLADELGVTYNTILNWCHGRNRPTYDYILQIAEILGIAPEDLYENVEE